MTRGLDATHFKIPYSWTLADKSAREAIRQDRQGPPPERRGVTLWGEYTNAYPNRDFLGDLVAAQVITTEESWSQLELRPRAISPRGDERILQLTYTRLKELLQQNILKFTPHGISKKGGILYYTDRLDRCLVFDYTIPHPSQKAATVTPLVDIKKPIYLYDIESAIMDAPLETRAALKNALVSDTRARVKEWLSDGRQRLSVAAGFPFAVPH